jgi:hypothetical protein
MGLDQPEPVISPPPNGMIGSAVWCTSSTATGREGAYATLVPSVPGHRRSGSEQVGALACEVDWP